ncbi:hypothetical protein Tco_1278729 [Tanacetum coccineum]
MSFLTLIYSLGNIIDGVDIEDLTIEQYLELTQNHAPNVGIKFDDMTIAEYLEYEETIKTQDYDKYQPHSAKADKRDNSHSNLRMQARDDALRNQEAQIDQLRRQEHEVTNIRAEINISTKEVSLGIKEDRVKIKMKEQECNFTTAVSEHLDKQPTSRDELSHRANSKTYWCEPVRQEHEKGYTLWASCDPYHEICNGGGIPDKKLKHYWKSTNNDDHISLEWEGLSFTNWEDPEKCGETKTRAIIEAMIKKLREEWFLGVSRDMDDLEGIIDYLELTLYDGFIDNNDEAYKRRRNKLLGIPYIEPPPIIKEEAEITKYNLGAGENPEARRQLSRSA